MNHFRLIVLLFLSFFSLNSFAAFNKIYIYYATIGSVQHISESYSDLCDIGHAFYSSSKPSNWVSLVFTTTICTDIRYEGYRTGVGLKGEPVGYDGDPRYNVYGFHISKDVLNNSVSRVLRD